MPPLFRKPSLLVTLTQKHEAPPCCLQKRLAAKMLEATRMGHTIAKQAGAINGESGLNSPWDVSMRCVPLTWRKRSTRVPVCTVPPL